MRKRAALDQDARENDLQVPAADQRGRREVVSQQPLADAEAILRKFTRRAFRRTVTDEDIRPFLDRVRAKLDVRSRTQIAGWMVRHTAGRPE